MIVPQLNYNANALFLWNRNQLDYPVNSFVGHKDAILDFGWRNSGASYENNDYDDYQLVLRFYYYILRCIIVFFVKIIMK